MKKLLPFILAACPLFAQACSFARGYERFTPDVASFEARTDEEGFALLPAPQVGAIRVKRGSGGPGAMCGDVGQLTVELDWPDGTAYRLNEVGFYFRIVDGQQPDRIFPLVPITGKIEGQRATFFFIWRDVQPKNQGALKLEAEVFAVNKGLEIGAPRRFDISSPR